MPVPAVHVCGVITELWLSLCGVLEGYSPLSRRKAEECWPIPGEVPGAVVTHYPLSPYWDRLPLGQDQGLVPEQIIHSGLCLGASTMWS